MPHRGAPRGADGGSVTETQIEGMEAIDVYHSDVRSTEADGMDS